MWQKLKELFAERKNMCNSFAWIIHISAPHKWKLLVLTVANCLITAVGVATAAVNKHIVDKAVADGGMVPYIIVAVLFAVFSLATSVWLSIFTVKVTEKYTYNIRSEMYEKILNSLWIRRTSHHSEGLVTRMTSDAGAVTSGVINVCMQIISTVLQFVMAFLLIWHYDSSLALVAVVSGPVAAFASVYIGLKLKKIQVEIQQSESDYREFLQENISHADVIKVFGRESDSLKSLGELQDRRFYWIKKKNSLSVCSAAIISGVFSGAYLFAFITGALKIANGEITFGTMTAFLSLMGQVQGPILALASLIPQFVGILASAGRIIEVIGMPKEEVVDFGELDAPLGILCENATVSYDDNVVVDKFNVNIKPGETVMLEGSSGIGKTTLIRSVLGFLSPDSGRVSIYDVDGKTVPCSCGTRKYISYVPQGNTLFSGTIADNLKMGNPSATEEQMQEALQAACAWEFVNELEDGINSVVGERGCGISEGQAQRISIARAFLKPFEILVLDEATSALDEKTEREILENLKKIKKNKTCLFVSHRKSVGEFADRVITI